MDSDAAKDQVADAREMQLLQDSLNRANPKYSMVGKSECYAYAVDAEEEGDCVHRWAYSRDDSGNPVIDHDSHARMNLEEIDSASERSMFLSGLVKRTELRADAEMKRRAFSLMY